MFLQNKLPVKTLPAHQDIDTGCRLSSTNTSKQLKVFNSFHQPLTAWFRHEDLTCVADLNWEEESSRNNFITFFALQK